MVMGRQERVYILLANEIESKMCMGCTLVPWVTEWWIELILANLGLCVGHLDDGGTVYQVK